MIEVDAGAVCAVLREVAAPIEARDIQTLTSLPNERLYAALVRLDATGEARMMPNPGGPRLWEAMA